MHDAEMVRGRERVGDVDCVLQDVPQRQRAVHQPGGERLALDVLEHEIVDAILLPDVVQEADVGMVEGRDDPRFALEPHHEFRAAGDVRREDLEGDRAVKA